MFLSWVDLLDPGEVAFKELINVDVSGGRVYFIVSVQGP